MCCAHSPPPLVQLLAYPPAGVIIAGITILLSTAQSVNATQGALIDLFERIENFFRRLEAYIELPPTARMTDVIVKVMVEVLLILALATREIKQGKIKTFLRRLEGRSDIEDALRRLDSLTQEESRMAAAQGLRATHGVAEGVKIIADDMHCIDDRVMAIEDRVRSVDDKVIDVDDKIDAIIDDGEKARGELRQLANDVGHQKRNQLRQDLRTLAFSPRSIY
ncbi:hypothetical protein F5148DRAFT_32631 [Russula earlei]|uniref:Uncharacterized protein n=1 Tax=Russula earlei TaxID=71964 RepID=A0ACC0U9P3_9AGAM|nr:hypothetical protein F5148DRAFT_32631 [Russula earlei]